jgi:hypothetical protein
LRSLHFLFAAALLFCGAVAGAAESADAARLLNTRAAILPQLQAKTFGEPLHLVSNETKGRMSADVYADMALPYARVATVLGSAESVCGVLSLHLNVRSCQPTHGAAGDVLMLSAGPKQGATAGTVYSMAYTLRVEASTADYLRVAMVAASGPLSTSDYRIVFEATPLEGQRTFLHFAYGYNFGTLARMAMGIYLATAGRTKIGFTVVGTGSDGRPQYIQGERGSVERNVMRNYLALQAYAGVTTGAASAQTEERLRSWFAMTERHAPQLHELDLDQYLQEKHADLARVPAAPQ